MGYAHFGFTSALERSIKMYSNLLRQMKLININVDVLPISKSFSSQFWPIMASIEDISIRTLPFVIDIYHGICKPCDANDFLSSFVNEFLNIKGILNAIFCDAPIKSFITYTKAHTGYFSCSKCIQKGDFVHNRIIFPEINNILQMTRDSVLEKLSIGMASQIPLDYMHLVCLGVMKRLLQIWINENEQNRLSTESIDSISQYLMNIKQNILSEFVRKPRTLVDIDKWKATELSQFLFLAIKIIANPQICINETFFAYAHSLLLYFVSNYGTIYGQKYSVVKFLIDNPYSEIPTSWLILDDNQQ
ncbi:hypothetical protein ACFW04_014545 [Cataglyphis niger]